MVTSHMTFSCTTSRKERNTITTVWETRSVVLFYWRCTTPLMRIRWPLYLMKRARTFRLSGKGVFVGLFPTFDATSTLRGLSLVGLGTTWNGYGYVSELRDVCISPYPVSWTFLVTLLLFTDGISGDKGAIRSSVPNNVRRRTQ